MTNKSILKIPIRKIHALEILQGKKKREYRPFTDFWVKRLCLCEDSEDKFLITSLKSFDEVYFYPYNNKWFLKCKVKAVDLCKVDDEFINYFGDEVECEKGGNMFVITIGEIIESNLAG